MLTNLETSKQKLLQIILIGQPELRELLARTDLRQLAQRITGRYHLEPLSRDETAQYIEHRLTVAGALVEIFDGGAKRELFRLTQGIPRLVNVICDRALLGAYSHEARSINRRLVRRAAAEVSGKADERAPWRWTLPLVAAFAAVVVAIGLWTIGEETPSAGLEATASTIAAEPSEEIVDAVIERVVDIPPAAVESETQAGLDKQLQLAADLTSNDAAVSFLFGLWQLEYENGSKPACEQSVALGMNCLYQHGSWSSLRQLDRPAVLTLTDSTGFDHRVVLTAIENGQATLSIGGVTVTHPSERISDLWFGQYMLLWKPPNGTSVSLGPGSRNQNVLWLRQSLAKIDDNYRSEPLDSDIFDGELGRTVRVFQRDHRLSVDGLAGQQTQIVINSLLASDGTPRLTTRLLARQ
jgi:general secretion pathway protein A